MPQMTVLEILNRTKVFFEKKGIPDARLDAEYIISHGLKMKSRMDIYLNFEKPLTDAELDVLRQMWHAARTANRCSILSATRVSADLSSSATSGRWSRTPKQKCLSTWRRKDLRVSKLRLS